MPNTATEHVTIGQLADQAAHAIHELNHRTRPTTDDLAYPGDTAEIIATLASMAGMLPQLLAQLTHWLAHQHHDGRLRLDSLAPLPDLTQTMHALTSSLQHAIGYAQHAAEELDTAHQHAAHLAAAEPVPNDQGPNTATRGQNSCRSVGPNHLTKRRDPLPAPMRPRRSRSPRRRP
jgi:hypothetical protein